MKQSLLIFAVLLIACGKQKSAQNNAKSSPGSLAAAERSKKQIPDSLKENISANFVTGRFNFKTRDDFIKVDPQDANKEVYLQKRTYAAFKKMADRAKKAGIRLIIVSGTRNFNYQKSIWDRKWKNSDASSALAKANEILQFSSMPMTSRHHWGTDLDINNLNNSYFESAKGKKEYDWLKSHANEFGFFQPYTNKEKNGRRGYNEEKWHWSYMPLASIYLIYYNKYVTNEDIKGFKGSNLAKKIDMVKNYVNGVSVKVKEYDRSKKGDVRR